MTVAEAGKKDGVLREVISKTAIETDAPVIGLKDLTLAGTFKPGRNVRSRIADVLVALNRIGHASPSDGGRTFSLLRVA